MERIPPSRVRRIWRPSAPDNKDSNFTFFFRMLELVMVSFSMVENLPILLQPLYLERS
jgi:hypothetical protein